MATAQRKPPARGPRRAHSALREILWEMDREAYLKVDGGEVAVNFDILENDLPYELRARDGTATKYRGYKEIEAQFGVKGWRSRKRGL